MISNGYIHEQIAAARHRDLLEAAEHARLLAQARQHHRVRQRPSWRGRAPHAGMTGEPRQRAGANVRTTYLTDRNTMSTTSSR